MRMIAAAALSALALAACQPVPPGPPPPPTGGTTYKAIGTEPFWDLQIGPSMVFTDRGNDVSVTQPTPVPINGVAGETYNTPRITANVIHAACSDGMSDRTYPDTVQVRVDGREYRGCGARSDWSGWVGEGSPPPSAGIVPALDGTNWRVAAINGRPTPVRDFTMNFTSDGRLSARFGCNSIGAGYTLSGASLSVGALMQTEIACPDMTFEQQGTAVLLSPVTVSADGAGVLLTSRGGTIALARG